MFYTVTITPKGGNKTIKTEAEIRREKRKKNKQVLIRMTQHEFDLLEAKVKRTRMTKNAFICNALRGVEIKEAPPYEFDVFNLDIRRIGNNLNQIARKLNANDPEERPAIKEIHQVVSEIYDVLGKLLDEYNTHPKQW